MLNRETVNLFANAFPLIFWMRRRPIRFTSLLSHIPFSGDNSDALRPIHILHKQVGKLFSLPVVSNTLRDELFPETRQGRRSGGLLLMSHTPVAFLLTNHKALPRETIYIRLY
jgi:hypothetical protein